MKNFKKINKSIIFFIFVMYMNTNLFSQVKNVNGYVYDKSSIKPLSGADVVFWDKNNSYTATSGENGFFTMKDVEIGTYTLLVSKEEYNFYQQTNIEINSGVEITLDIPLKERIVTLKEVEIKSKYKVETPSNAYLEYVDVDNIQRLSGIKNDPINFLKNIAAVKGVDDSRNLISVRGNSPFGILYKIENMPVLAPIHFSNIGINGSQVTMLNTHYLSDYNFLIGSFESNNGNALAGVVDVSLKRIRNNKTQGIFASSWNGFELGVEGKFSKKSRANYLISYRYSFLDAIHQVIKLFGGEGLGDNTPAYQDVTFKVNLPYSLKGNVSVWGMIGPSNVTFKDDIQIPNDYNEKTKTEFKLNYLTGLFGVNLQHRFNDHFHGKFFTGTSLYEYSGKRQVIFETKPNFDLIYFKYNINVLNVGGDMTYKLNAKNDFMFGVAADINFFKVTGQIKPYLKSYPDAGVDINTVFNYLEGDKITSLLKAYVNYKHYFAENFTLNAGVYGQIFLLNNSFSIEPRISSQYTLNEKNIFSVTAGLHSQTQPLDYYFTREDLKSANSNVNQANIDNLQLNKSFQSSINYRRIFSDKFNISASVYYQYHFNIATDDADPTFSVLNTGSNFFFNQQVSLNNKGLGENYGFELDVRFNKLKGFYGSAAFSIFSSKYAGADGVWRSTFYDIGQTVNANVGYELKLGKIFKLFFNSKVAYAGGNKITPFDIEKTMKNSSLFTTIYQNDKAFTERLPDYFTLNLNLGFEINFKKVTHTLMFDIQNLTGNNNVWGKFINPYTGETKYENQFTLNYPIFYYKLNF